MNVQHPRCPHGLNPRACLTCYHAPKPRQAAAPAQQRPVLGGQAPIVNPPSIQRAIDNMHGVAGERTVVPAPQGPQAIVPEKRARPEARENATSSHVPLEPAKSTLYEPWRVNEKTGLEEPPKRPQLIDMVPRHPEVDK